MTALMGSGIELMYIGMGIVFIFLAMLVVIINFMSMVILRYFPEPTVVHLSVRSAEAGNDQRIIAAISAAVRQYRAKYNE
ncbi:MAG: OadG family transporter subunit [Methylococcaceae bacterium]|jgi:oxaloacetate decarboxylase gamma subunit